MKKIKLSEEDKLQFNAIPNFTKQLEQQLALAPSSEIITLNNVTSMPTYALAALALENNSPEQVIRVMEAMKKRYVRKPNFNEITLGFLEAIEGKAYGYIALNTKDLKQQQKFYKYALKCFNSGKNRGYYDAILDLADLQKKLGNIAEGEMTAFKVFNDTFESYTRLGEIYYDFHKLVTSASRVIEGKRPLIEDRIAFEYAMRKYSLGALTSSNCMMYFGLSLIIDGEKEKGLKIVKNNLKNFKEKNKDYQKVLFASDAKRFEEDLNILENKIIKNNIR